jgi:uncharacterized ion transporter superfamily protein YfcC
MATRSKGSTKDKRWYEKLPHVYVILFIIIVLAAVLTYVVPSGAFDTITVDGRQVVDPEGFHYTDVDPVSFFDIFRAPVYGLIDSAMIVFLIFILGGSIEIFDKTRAIKVGMSKAILKFGEKGSTVLIIGAMAFFAVLGGYLGFAEGAIPFVPLAVSLAIGLGYDPLVGVGIATLSTLGGFAMGPMNPYTVGVSHDIAGLPLFSGIGFRSVVLVVFLALAVHHVLRYAKKTKADPSKSLMQGIDYSDLVYDVESEAKETFTGRQKTAIVILGATIVVVLVGVINWGWYLNEMSAAFLLGAIVAGLINKFSVNKLADTFLAGASKITYGALIVGFARGIQWVLEQGGISGTIIYGLAQPLQNVHPYLSAIGMFFANGIINLFIPSGSGQAAAIMPIMIPLSDLIGITRQTATLAFQFGDGIMNLAYPTLGALMVYLAFGKVSFDRWIRFLLPFLVKFILLGVIALIVAVAIGFGPF